MKKKWGTKKYRRISRQKLIDIILCEAVELHPKKNIFEIDTTGKTQKRSRASVLEIVKKKFQPIKTI